MWCMTGIMQVESQFGRDGLKVETNQVNTRCPQQGLYAMFK
jgi:hypothetical protein